MNVTLCFLRRETPNHVFTLNSAVLNPITQIKLLGVTIQDNLIWESHVTDIIYRASRRLYTLCILKKFHAPLADLVSVYTSYIRPIMEYACQVWHVAPLADTYAIELKVFKNVLT